jgi:hypothetical protein
MTYCPRIYFSNVCNSYLDLSDFELSSEDFDKIMYCLLNPEEVPMSLWADVVDFTNSVIISPNNEQKEITRDLLPPQLFDNDVNFVFSQ